MAISAKQNEDLQKQYDLLRSQGQSKADATGSIKNKLNTTVVENPVAGTGETAFNMLKTDFQNGGVEGDWIGNGPVFSAKAPAPITTSLDAGGIPKAPVAPAITPIAGTDAIAKNNKLLSGATAAPSAPVAPVVPSATPVTPSVEAIAGVPQGSLGNAQTAFLESNSQFIQENMKNELANLDKEKQALQESIKSGALSSEEQSNVLAPYEQFLSKVEAFKNVNKEQIKREQQETRDRYTVSLDRQRKSNELALINAQKIAAITGVGFTSGGLQGINNIMDEGNQAITTMEGERESMLSKYKDADAKLDIEYLDTLNTIQADSKKALQDRYNSIATQIQKIETEKGTTTKEGLAALKTVAQEYFSALDKQWEKDYKVMDFNYKKLMDYKKDVRDQEQMTREQQKGQLDLLQKGDLTVLSDEDIMNIGQDMDLDTAQIKGLILVRERQKKNDEIEANKDNITPYQRESLDIERQKMAMDKGSQDWSKLDDKTLFNQRTGQTQSVKEVLNTAKGQALLDLPDGSTVPSGRGQCGEYVNDVLGTPSLFGDTLASKKKVATDKEPTIGGAVVFSSEGKYSKYGHVGIVVGEDDDYITVKSSNWDGDEKLTTEKVRKDSKMIQGYYAPKQKVNPADIGVFNSLTPSDKKKMQDDPDYRAFVETKKKIMDNPDAKLDDILEYSRDGKDVGDSDGQQLAKFGQALDQIGPLQESIGKLKTGPILGLLQSYNPYDSEAQALKAEISSLIPNLARGVYGEVGVLTDADIANYAKTVPNIRSTEDTNKLVLAMTLQTVANGYRSKLQTLAAGGRDVSGFGGTYKQIQSRVDQLLSEIEGKGTPAPKTVSSNPRINEIRGILNK